MALGASLVALGASLVALGLSLVALGVSLVALCVSLLILVVCGFLLGVKALQRGGGKGAMLFGLLKLNKESIFMSFLLFFLQSFWAMELLGNSCKGLVLSLVALGLGFGGPLNWGQLEYCRPSGP